MAEGAITIYEDIVLTLAKSRTLYEQWHQQMASTSKFVNEMIPLSNIACGDSIKGTKNEINNQCHVPLKNSSNVNINHLVFDLKNSIKNLECGLKDLSMSVKYYEANKNELNNLYIEIENKKKYIFQMREEIEKMTNNLSNPQFNSIRRRHSSYEYPPPPASSSNRSYSRAF